MKQKTIYVSSQNFGYGPTSNLFGILKSLKSKSNSFRVHGIKNESLELFTSKEPEIIDALSDNIDLEKAEIVLSSFDPFAIFDAWLNNIPTIFYCNLFWYWDIYNKKHKLLSYKQQLLDLKEGAKKTEAKKLFSEIFNENPHLGIFMGFMLATYSFTRKFPSIEKFHDIFKNEINLSLFDIYIPYKLSDFEQDKKNILIQLSGGRNCIVTDEENITYLKLCLELAKHLSSIYTKFTITICANPKILSMLDFQESRLASNIKIIPSVSQSQNLQMMESSLAMFSSPGLETVYESIYTQCPLFLIPEQNAGQYSIFKLLNATGYNPDRFLINEAFPNRVTLPGEEDAHEIYKIIKNNLLNCENTRNLFFENSAEFFNAMIKQKERKKYLEMSLNSLKRNSSDNPFTTNDTISDFIIERYA